LPTRAISACNVSPSAVALERRKTNVGLAGEADSHRIAYARSSSTQARMKLPKRKSLFRLTNGIFFTFLAAFVFAPGQAHAECGDYVMIGGKAAPDSPALPRHDNTRHRQERPRGAPQDGHAPCSGPLCSRQAPPITSVPAAPAPFRNPNESCGYTPATPDSADGDSSYLMHDLVTAQPLHCHMVIYHPPR
jgi:hypothetical protein